MAKKNLGIHSLHFVGFANLTTLENNSKTPKGTVLLLLFNLHNSLNFIILGLAPNLLKEPMLSNAFFTPFLPVNLSQPLSLLKVTKNFYCNEQYAYLEIT